jgi:aerobic-type carbon monoxide dehydrogenase small subunit (CoxS/CutS family)
MGERLLADKRSIVLTVNGRRYESRAEARMTLADFLRDELDLTGTHLGCEHGVCGACTILMDGAAIRSCLLLAVQAEGHDLQTVEGLVGENGELHPIQEAFAEEHALQCGFCTPGFLMAIAEYLEEEPDPQESDIRKRLSGNLCRCTGYQNIVKAVQNAASRRREARTVG